ncbi:phage tail assembly protein [Leclercia adecarboxylata]|uniref:phage tail assembly protein n=1 Tax=Leclercia adecarboxylata TaxID=83655 RepID=UPI002DBAA91B|nr:phage tail assembly protein [Leclercia adecarboxylata]MEB5748653.1 phage tail assembly protein [Leclercia adecarboxylata]
MTTSLLDSVEIPLSRPYEINGVKHDKLVMFEPKLRDKILFSKDKGDPEEKSARMLARLLNLEEKDLLNLPACDYARLEDAFNEMVKDPSDRNLTFS